MGILQARILEWVAFPSPGDPSNPGIEPRSPALQADSLQSEPPGKPAGEKHNPIHSFGVMSLPLEAEKNSKSVERMSVASFKKRRKMTLWAWFSPSVSSLEARLLSLLLAQQAQTRERSQLGVGGWGGLGPVGMETEKGSREGRGGCAQDRPGASRLSVGLLTSGKLHRADVPLPATLLISTSVCLSSGCQQRHGLLP